MYTTYHLTSAQDVNSDILEAIKATFKSKPIIIIVEEDEGDYQLNGEMKAILDERILEERKDYLTKEDSINLLNKKYDL